MSDAPRRNDPFDLSSFMTAAPTKPTARPDMDAVTRAGEDLGFRDRSPKPAAPAMPTPALAPVRRLRRRQSDRHLQVNIRASAATIDELVQVSEANRWAFGETLQFALDALKRERAR